MKSKHRFKKEDLWNCDVTFWVWMHEYAKQDYSESLANIVQVILDMEESGDYYIMSEEDEKMANAVIDAVKSYILTDLSLMYAFREFVSELLRNAALYPVGNPNDFKPGEWKMLLKRMSKYFKDTQQVERSALDEFFRWLPYMWD
jgi:hypothetical protein